MRLTYSAFSLAVPATRLGFDATVLRLRKSIAFRNSLLLDNSQTPEKRCTESDRPLEPSFLPMHSQLTEIRGMAVAETRLPTLPKSHQGCFLISALRPDGRASPSNAALPWAYLAFFYGKR
jgi:hypothetical protein